MFVRLKWRVLELEKEASHELCHNQISTMEKAVEQIKLELDLSRQEHTLDCRTFANERLELETKLENVMYLIYFLYAVIYLVS